MPTCGNASYCASALWGRDTPAAAHANIVSPEQSKTSGPEPAYTYGLPSWASAVLTATWAWGFGAGTLGEGPPVAAGEEFPDDDAPDVAWACWAASACCCCVTR